MTDWVTISSLATAGGTLVLALATFSSVKSANRSARLAERSLLAGLRPLLIPSNEDDLPERIGFGDGHVLTVPGHGAAVKAADGNVYLAIALRNGGPGLAVIHGWRLELMERVSTNAPTGSGINAPHLDAFRRQQRDLYIPAGETGFWQGALREPDDADHETVSSWGTPEWGAPERRLLVDLLYGDYEGGQRTIARFSIVPAERDDRDQGERADVVRYWNVDGDDPR